MLSALATTTTKGNLLVLLSVAAAVALSSTEAFAPHHAAPVGRHSQLQRTRTTRSPSFISSNSNSKSALFLQDSSFDFEDDEEDDDEDDDEEDDDDDEIRIDPDSLGDWRTFRRNLAATPETEGEAGTTTTEGTSFATEKPTVVRQDSPNEKVLKAQSEELAKEYTGVWAHEISTVSIVFTVLQCSARLYVECVLYFTILEYHWSIETAPVH
jgi:hypothetical protein